MIFGGWWTHRFAGARHRRGTLACARATNMLLPRLPALTAPRGLGGSRDAGVPGALSENNGAGVLGRDISSFCSLPYGGFARGRRRF